MAAEEAQRKEREERETAIKASVKEKIFTWSQVCVRSLRCFTQFPFFFTCCIDVNKQILELVLCMFRLQGC